MYINGVNCSEAIGSMGKENLKNPYPPIFNSTPANKTEPAVGASTWASGNQVWTGHIGILTANEAKKANQSQGCIFIGTLYDNSVGISVVPAS